MRRIEPFSLQFSDFSTLFLAVFVLFCSFPPSFAQTHLCDTTKSRFEAGRHHYYRGEYAFAIEDFTGIPKESSDYPKSLYELAWAYYEIGDYLQSINILSEATYYADGEGEEIQGLIAQNYTYNLPIAEFDYNLNIRTPEEVSFFIHQGEVDEDPERLFRLGLAYKRRGEFKSAFPPLIIALSIRSDYHEIQETLGRLYLEEGRYPEALFCLVRDLDIRPRGFGVDRELNRLGALLSLVQGKESPFPPSPPPVGELIDGLKELLEKSGSLDSVVQAYHFPWLSEIAAMNNLDCLAHQVLQSADPVSTGEWMEENAERMKAYLAWDQQRADSLLAKHREIYPPPPPEEE